MKNCNNFLFVKKSSIQNNTNTIQNTIQNTEQAQYKKN